MSSPTPGSRIGGFDQACPWWDLKNSSIAKYYPGPDRGPVHAVYLDSLDRFLFVDSFDFNATLHAVKLLSSKMSLAIHILPLGATLTNENCLRWSLKKENEVRLSEIEKPRILLLNSIADLCHVGLPQDLDVEVFNKHQEYSFFVLRATFALRLTDAFLNEADHPFFMKLFPFAESEKKLKYSFDRIKWPQGFIFNIERILYLSDSVEEALNKILKILPLPTGEVKAPYSSMFYDLLGWRPSK